ncbi:MULTISPECIES: hypothetical protein [unclassified Microbacterium]|uniref:hypothetical protein n=1 Tax=unclassified Microbacterium TaxID=2609290 RepID=UPI00300FDBC7
MTEQNEKLVEKKTIGEVERIVHGSGLWDGNSAVEFSNDGETWSETWAPTDAHPLPEFARIEVYRKDVRIPTKVTIRWDEQVPRADEFWAGKWVGAPMRHFGRTARMVGFRQTFRDLLGNIVIEDEGDERTLPDATPAQTPAERDWRTEIAEAQSLVLFEQIEKDARAARIFTPSPEGTALHIAFRARRRELTAADPDPWSTQAPGAVVSAPDEHVATVAPARPAPQDHLPPANRAARRKAARKKGGKR